MGFICKVVVKLNVVFFVINWQIIELEDEIGVVFFECLLCGLWLIFVGEFYVEYICEVMKSYQWFEFCVKVLKMLDVGKVCIVMMIGFVVGFMFVIVLKFVVQYLCVKIFMCNDIGLGMMFNLVSVGEVDIGIGFNILVFFGICMFVVFDVFIGVVLLLGYLLMQQVQVGLGEFIQECLVFVMKLFSLCEVIDFVLVFLFVVVELVIEINMIEVVKQFVCLGVGVLFMNLLDIIYDCVCGDLVFWLFFDLYVKVQQMKVFVCVWMLFDSVISFFVEFLFVEFLVLLVMFLVQGVKSVGLVNNFEEQCFVILVNRGC